MAVESYGATVTDLLAVTGDPVRDLRAAKESARQNAATERERTTAALCYVGVPATTASAWLDRRGLPSRRSTASCSTPPGDAPGSGQRFPSSKADGILLTVLTATALDDPHALDRGSSTATAVLRLLGHDLPDSAETWRMAREAHGIDCDPVPSRVLVLDLPHDGDAP